MSRGRKRRIYRKLGKIVVGKLVKKLKKRYGNAKQYKKGLHTKTLNNAHSQRGGFSL